MGGDPVEAGVNAIMGAAAGATYGFIAFARKREDATRETETWDVRKSIPTVLVAAGIGAMDGYVAGPEAVTPESIATRIAAYGGVIFAVEQLYKTLRDRRERRRQRDGGANGPDEPNRDENDTENERNVD
jgi:hypothetical protein